MKPKTKKPSGADLLKAQLSRVVTSDKRGGGDVAKSALSQPESTPSPVEAPKEAAPKEKAPAPEKEASPPRAKPKRATLEKITISLHQDDLSLLDDIDLALRKVKAPMRGVGTSTLIKVALRGFQAEPLRLAKLLEEVQAQDGRRRKS